MTPGEIEKLIRIVLGPEEDWSEADAEYVLRLYGVDPADASRDACDLILRMIDDAREKGVEVSPMLLRMLSSLSEPLKSDERIAEAEDFVKRRMKLSARAVRDDEEFRFLRAARRVPGKLSAADEQILKELEEELAGDLDSREQKS